MITVHMGDAHGTGTQSAGGLRERIPGNQGRAGNFERNLRRERQGAAHSNQCSACRNVQRRCKFQQLPSVFVAAADKDGNGQRQAGILPGFSFRASSLQPQSLKGGLTEALPHLGGQTQSKIWTPGPAKHFKAPFFKGIGPSKMMHPNVNICRLFAVPRSFPHALGTLDCKLFPFGDHLLAFFVDRPKTMS
jgi:hypothetical protein